MSFSTKGLLGSWASLLFLLMLDRFGALGWIMGGHQDERSIFVSFLALCGFFGSMAVMFGAPIAIIVSTHDITRKTIPKIASQWRQYLYFLFMCFVNPVICFVVLYSISSSSTQDILDFIGTYNFRNMSIWEFYGYHLIGILIGAFAILKILDVFAWNLGFYFLIYLFPQQSSRGKGWICREKFVTDSNWIGCDGVPIEYENSVSYREYMSSVHGVDSAAITLTTLLEIMPVISFGLIFLLVINHFVRGKNRGLV
jgi:hypothetical protein